MAFDRERTFDFDSSFDKGRRYTLRYHVTDYFIPGAREEDLDCIQDQLCVDCQPYSPEDPDQDDYDSEYGLCPANSTSTTTGDPCVFDPAVVPTWYLQFLIDRYSSLCASGLAPPPVVPPGLSPQVSICNIVYCAQDVLDNGPPAGLPPFFSGPCGFSWGVILTWWQTVGANLTALHCAHAPMDDIPGIPGEGQVQLKMQLVQLPPGSRVLGERCIDVEVGTDCCESG